MRGVGDGARRPALVEALSDLFDRGRRPMTLLPVLGSLRRRAGPSGGWCCCGRSTRRACSAAADVHVALPSRGPGTRTDDDTVLLAAALAVRCPRLGHVCVDLTTIRSTASTEAEDQVDLDALPWPDARGLGRPAAHESAGGRGPSVAARGDPAVPGPVLVGRMPRWRPICSPGRNRPVDGVDTDCPAPRPRHLVLGEGGPGPPAPRRGVRRPTGRVGHRRGPGNRQDDDRRPRPGAPGRAGLCRRSAPAPDRPGRPHREGGGPTRRGGQRRGGTPPDLRRTNGSGSSNSAARRCTGCWAGARITPGSATTGSIGSPTTWSSSMRPPWCRSRSWPAWSRPCAPTAA